MKVGGKKLYEIVWLAVRQVTVHWTDQCPLIFLIGGAGERIHSRGREGENEERADILRVG